MPISARRRAACLLLTALVAGGCVSRVGGSADGTAAPTTEAPPSAADGTDLDACADGTCEVSMTERKVDVPTPIGTLKLTVTKRGYSYSMVREDGGNLSGSGEGNCVAFFAIDSNGSGSTCYTDTDEPPELTPESGVMLMQVITPDSDHPVLRLATD